MSIGHIQWFCTTVKQEMKEVLSWDYWPAHPASNTMATPSLSKINCGIALSTDSSYRIGSFQWVGVTFQLCCDRQWCPPNPMTKDACLGSLG